MGGGTEGGRVPAVRHPEHLIKVAHAVLGDRCAFRSNLSRQRCPGYSESVEEVDPGKLSDSLQRFRNFGVHIV